MSIAIDATVGGAASNSFVTLAEAQAYMDGRLNASAWAGTATDAIITVVAPGALTGDTAISIAPLTVALEIGDFLPFGVGQVVVLAADANVDDETITVETLPFDLAPGTEATVSGADIDHQHRALVEATRELSAKTWVGDGRATTTQALSWPRFFAPNPDLAWPGTWYYLATEIPQRIKDATSELALQFLIAGTTDIASLDTTLNVKVKKVDVLETEYFGPNLRAKGLDRFPSVMRYIRPLLVGAGVSVPLVRG